MRKKSGKQPLSLAIPDARHEDENIKQIYKELNKIFKSQHGDYSRVLFTKPSQFENPMISRESSELFIDELAHHNRASFKGDHYDKLQDKAINRLCRNKPECIAKHKSSFDNFQYDDKLSNATSLEEKTARAQNSGEGTNKTPRDTDNCLHFQKLKPAAILKLSRIGMGHARYACVDGKTGAYEICDEDGNWIREVSFIFTDIAKKTNDRDHSCFQTIVKFFQYKKKGKAKASPFPFKDLFKVSNYFATKIVMKVKITRDSIRARPRIIGVTIFS